ncbi:MAG: sugar ABC transporter permease [Clostridia bacterium]|nr:sugar ABC transporter permease [Clostridia bacterium]
MKSNLLGKATRRRHISSKDVWGWLFMAPFIISLVVFGVIPVFYSLALSLFSYNLYEAPIFVGLDNFSSLFLDDGEFSKALKNTLIYAFTVTPIVFFINFFLAWVINSFKKGVRNLLVVLFYIPQMTTGVAMTVIWLYIFSGDRYGLLNYILTTLGWITTPVQWTTNTEILFGVVIFIGVMMGSGMSFLTFVAAFQALPADMYEAGRIDGIKNNFQELVYLTAPQMKPQLLFSAVTSSVSAFAIADIPSLVAGFPSPDYAAHTIALHMRDYGFTRFEVGYASAISIVLFVITFLTGFILRKALSTKD